MSLLTSLKELGVTRAIIVTSRAGLANLLVAHAIANLKKRENLDANIIENSILHKETLLEFLARMKIEWNGKVFSGIESLGRAEPPIILYSIGKDVIQHKKLILSHKFEIRVLFVPASKGLGTLLGYPVIRITGLEGKFYRASSSMYGTVNFVMDLNGLREYRSRSENLVWKAKNLLIDSMMDYGEITTKDALIILSARLGMTKEEARKLLSMLVERGEVRIKKGRIEL